MCLKLVTKYEALKDTIGTGYVSDLNVVLYTAMQPMY